MADPVITELIPDTIPLGAPSFVIEVRGIDFEEGCVIVWNGGDEPTSFVHSGLVTTGVNMDSVAVPNAVTIQVRNPGGEVSNSFGFTFTPVAPSGWPSIADLAEFVKVPQDDASLGWALNAAIAYGKTVLGSYVDVNGDVFVWPPDDAVFQACLDYAGSLYTQRIGQADFYTSPEQGSTPQQRYRRMLLAARPVAIA